MTDFRELIADVLNRSDRPDIGTATAAILATKVPEGWTIEQLLTWGERVASAITNPINGDVGLDGWIYGRTDALLAALRTEAPK